MCLRTSFSKYFMTVGVTMTVRKSFKLLMGTIVADLKHFRTVYEDREN